MSTIMAEYQEKVRSGVKFTGTASSWIRQSLKPIMKCLTEHCDGDVLVFADKHSEGWKVSKFNCLTADRCGG